MLDHLRARVEKSRMTNDSRSTFPHTYSHLLDDTIHFYLDPVSFICEIKLSINNIALIIPY